MGATAPSSHKASGGQTQTSYNLSAIFNYFPSKFLKRKGEALETGGTGHGIDRVDASISSAELQQLVRQPKANFPAPFGFFTSAYVFGLFLVFIVLHRIQHTVMPVQRPFRPHVPHRSNRRLSSLRRFLPTNSQATHTAMRFSLHLPTLYLLSRKLLLWMLLVIQTSGIRIGCCASLMAWAEKKEMSEVCWSTFVSICAAFCVEAFVRALDGQGTTSAVFGLGAGENSNTSPFNLVGYAFLLHIYSAPSSHSYYPREKSMPTRPDKHVVITIAIPLLQLTLLHILSISKRLSAHRFLPTALSSCLSLTHFHLTLLSHFASLPLPSFLTPTRTDAVSTRPRNPHTGRPQSYPLLNYVPNIFETLLILSILLTHLLNLLTRIMLIGSGQSHANYSHSTRRRAGMPSRTGQNSSSRSIVKRVLEPFTYLRSVLSSLPYDQDFGIVLLRLGTQSLEAAAGRGWRNEVAGVYAGSRYFGGRLPSEHEAGGEKEAATQRGTRGNCKETVEYGSMWIGRADVGGMVNASITSPTTATGSRSTRAVKESMPSKMRTKTKTLQGLRSEIRTVSSSFLPLDTALTGAEETDHSSGNLQRDFFTSLLHILGLGLRLRALKLFVWAVIGAGIGVGRRIMGMFRKNDNVLGQENGEREGGGDIALEEEEGEEAYRRFLKGESFSSSEEEDGEYGSGSDVDVSREDEDELYNQEADEDDPYGDSEEGKTAGQNEILALLADILFSSGASDLASGSELVAQDQGAGLRDVLAHLLHTPLAPTSNPSDQDPTAATTGPMTRGRWGVLAGKYSATTSTVDNENDEERWLDQHRHFPASRELDETGNGGGGEEKSSMAEARACVVCLTEVREVICWPCRCLAMCDGCREALASKSLPSKHRCPCCRRSVEGFSRIYIP